MANKKPPLKLNLKKGALHKDLGIPEDKKIPLNLIRKKLKNSSGTMKKRLMFALNVKTGKFGNK